MGKLLSPGDTLTYCFVRLFQKRALFWFVLRDAPGAGVRLPLRTVGAKACRIAIWGNS
jgi:hypothetical protein